MNLDSSKANAVGDIPTDMLKQTIDIHLPIITQITNVSVDNNCYPDNLKLAEVNPVFKKKDDLDVSSVKGLRQNYVPTNRLYPNNKFFNRL